MTEKNSLPPMTDDESPYEMRYDHGRMPLFMKIVWVGFLVLATWYVVVNLLSAVGDELGG